MNRRVQALAPKCPMRIFNMNQAKLMKNSKHSFSGHLNGNAIVNHRAMVDVSSFYNYCAASESELEIELETSSSESENTTASITNYQLEQRDDVNKQEKSPLKRNAEDLNILKCKRVKSSSSFGESDLEASSDQYDTVLNCVALDLAISSDESDSEIPSKTPKLPVNDTNFHFLVERKSSPDTRCNVAQESSIDPKNICSDGNNSGNVKNDSGVFVTSEDVDGLHQSSEKICSTNVARNLPVASKNISNTCSDSPSFDDYFGTLGDDLSNYDDTTDSEEPKDDSGIRRKNSTKHPKKTCKKSPSFDVCFRAMENTFSIYDNSTVSERQRAIIKALPDLSDASHDTSIKASSSKARPSTKVALKEISNTNTNSRDLLDEDLGQRLFIERSTVKVKSVWDPISEPKNQNLSRGFLTSKAIKLEVNKAYNAETPSEINWKHNFCGVTKSKFYHDLLPSHELIFNEIITNAFDADESIRQEVLDFLSEDVVLRFMLPTLLHYLQKLVEYNILTLNLLHLKYCIHMLRAIADNTSLELIAYLHLILPSLLSCVVSYKLCALPLIENHWAVRDLAVDALKQIFTIRSLPNAMSRVINVFRSVLSSTETPLDSKYGAIKALIEFNQINVIMPNLKNISNSIELLMMSANNENAADDQAKITEIAVVGLLKQHCIFELIKIHKGYCDLNLFRYHYGNYLGSILFEQFVNQRKSYEEKVVNRFLINGIEKNLFIKW